jgi:hypothetical protein
MAIWVTVGGFVKVLRAAWAASTRFVKSLEAVWAVETRVSVFAEGFQ